MKLVFFSGFINDMKKRMYVKFFMFIGDIKFF